MWNSANHILLLGMLSAIVLIEGFWLKSYTGNDCLNPCTRRGYDYYWCNTETGWGYCSPFNNMSSSGKVCRKYHPCRQLSRDFQYLQCELEDGGVDHCSNNDDYVGIHAISSTYEAFCMDECAKHGYSYYWCKTFKGWDYCSPHRDTTYRGVPCRIDHFCNQHGKTYNWCYTATSWDYCGSVIDCAYWPAEDRLGNATECTIQQGRRQIRFEYEPDVTIDKAQNHSLRQDALKLIEDWHHVKIERGVTAGTLLKHSNVRFDQGFANGRDHAILLLQIIDKPDFPGTGSTLAKVLVPTDTPLNLQFVRRAFMNSLNRREKVTLNITNTL